MGPTQDLTQKVCDRYGWSALIEKDSDSDGEGYWTCTVTVGVNDRRRKWSYDASDDAAKGRKRGTAAASQAALDGLKEYIETQEAKPVKELTEVFSQPINIYESNRKNWEYFWKHKPAVVGIDTEGNQISPPVLVQISTDDYTIIEVPQEGGISYDLSRLLSDESIVKVFCDNFAHKDKKSLGLTEIPADLTAGQIVDLEAIASKSLGPVKVARGLSRIVTLCMPELNVQIRKPADEQRRLKNVGCFSLIEQGKAPRLMSMYDFSAKERQYAALDAWCTLQAYKRFRQAEASVS